MPSDRRPDRPVAQFRRPVPAAVRPAAGGLPLRLWADGVLVFTLEPAAAEQLGSGCRALVELLDGRNEARVLFPAAYADEADSEGFRRRHDAAMRAATAAAARRIARDTGTTGTSRDIELDVPELHVWFVGIGALRLLDGGSRGAALTPAVVRCLHHRLAELLLPEPPKPVLVVESPRRPLWGKFGWGVAVGLVVGMLAVIGAQEPPVLAPEQVVAGRVPQLVAPAESISDVPPPELSALHQEGLVVAPTTCALPEMGTSNESVEAWVQDSITCLDAAWAPVLAAAGLEHRRPVVQRFHDEIRTRCRGELRTTAFYCRAGEIIAVSPSNELDQVPVGDRAGWLLGVMSHEYGHHVQALSGTLAASDALQESYPPGGPQWLEVSRRMELQANCLAGVGVASMSGRGSVGAAEAAGARRRVSSGDDVGPGGRRDHGTAAHNQQWFDRGMAAGSPATCNTWVASDAEVD